VHINFAYEIQSDLLEKLAKGVEKYKGQHKI